MDDTNMNPVDPAMDPVTPEEEEGAVEEATDEEVVEESADAESAE